MQRRRHTVRSVEHYVPRGGESLPRSDRHGSITSAARKERPVTHRPPRVVVALSALLLVATFGGFTHPRVTVAADSPFVDISASTFKADIEWLWAQKITVGCEPTRYCPNQLVTRGQMASFVVRMFKLTEGADVDAFTDDETS